MVTTTPPDQAVTRARVAHDRALRSEIRQRRYCERHPQSTLCLGIRPQVFGTLRRAGVHTIEQLGKLTPEQVRETGVSTAGVSTLIAALDSFVS